MFSVSSKNLNYDWNGICNAQKFWWNNYKMAGFYLYIFKPPILLKMSSKMKALFFQKYFLFIKFCNFSNFKSFQIFAKEPHN